MGRGRLDVAWSLVFGIVVDLPVVHILVMLLLVRDGHYFLSELVCEEVKDLIGETVLETELGCEVLGSVTLPYDDGVHFVLTDFNCYLQYFHFMNL